MIEEKETKDSPEQLVDIENLEGSSLNELILLLKSLNDDDAVISSKNEINAIKDSFTLNFQNQLDTLNDENEDDIAFRDKLYAQKKEFDTVLFDIKNRQKKIYKTIEKELENNVKERLQIIEEIKGLIHPENNSTHKFSEFNQLRERWKNAGACPREQSNHIWNTYHFHVENFFDYIHLDKDARDLEFKNNYEKKVEILSRLSELVAVKDIRSVLSDIKLLQKVYREDIGPVEHTKREVLWSEFDAINNRLNERKKELKEIIAQEQEANLDQKRALIKEIYTLIEKTEPSFDFWKTQTQKLNSIREAFTSIGRTPKKTADIIWPEFRNAVKEFNDHKNIFFKGLREEYQKNADAKRALISRAKALENSEDWLKATEELKRIQQQWRKIGYVPAKLSNTLWKEFKTSCDTFFNRLKEQKKSESQDEIVALENKKIFLSKIKTTKLSGDTVSDIETIQNIIKEWNEIGRVPYAKKDIQNDFNQAIDGLYAQLKIEKDTLEMLQFKSAIERIAAFGDTKKLADEEIYVSKKITEIKSEIIQLENNIQFISNAKKTNPLIQAVQNNIENHKKTLEKWLEKKKIVQEFRK
jgi:hypothetical protein